MAESPSIFILKWKDDGGKAEGVRVSSGVFKLGTKLCLMRGSELMGVTGAGVGN